MSAADLAAADVVLTTYDVLRVDVHRQPDTEVQHRALRRPKRWEQRSSRGATRVQLIIYVCVGTVFCVCGGG